MPTKTTKAQAAQIFDNAANYIKCFGWRESGMAKDGAPRCSMGALASAYPAKNWDKRLASFMYNALYKELGGINLTEFNRQAKSGLEVAKLFEKTAQSIKTN